MRYTKYLQFSFTLYSANTILPIEGVYHVAQSGWHSRIRVS